MNDNKKLFERTAKDLECDTSDDALDKVMESLDFQKPEDEPDESDKDKEKPAE